jgi:hypothetical protein
MSNMLPVEPESKIAWRIVENEPGDAETRDPLHTDGEDS